MESIRKQVEREGHTHAEKMKDVYYIEGMMIGEIVQLYCGITM